MPKGLELVGGRRIIDRVADALRGVTSELLLVANAPEADRWLPGVAVVSDIHPGRGGLAGVEAALSVGDALVVAWDMPFVSSALLQTLFDSARANDADVVVPESESPYGFEPFCAFYSKRVAPQLSAFLGEGGGAARDFIRRLSRVHRLALADVERIGEPQRLLFSANTADDLERARAMASTAR
jgi:molybdopterin-guanine dinucleotide biosynthesis protein A